MPASASRRCRSARRGRSANVIAQRRRQLDGSTKLLGSLSYQSVLQRGFALVRDSAGRTVRSIAQAPAGARLSIEVADGRIAADVPCDAPAGTLPPGADLSRTVAGGSPHAAAVPTSAENLSRSRPARTGGRGNQGELF